MNYQTLLRLIIGLFFLYPAIRSAIRYWPMRIPVSFIMIAMCLNFTVCFANHGKMPVSGYYDSTKVEDNRHTMITTESKLPWLADVHGPPMARYSIGDVFAFLGILSLIAIMVIKLCMRS